MMAEKETTQTSQAVLAAGADAELVSIILTDFGIDDPPELGQPQVTHFLLQEYDVTIVVKSAQNLEETVPMGFYLCQRMAADRVTELDISTIVLEQLTDEKEHQRILRHFGGATLRTEIRESAAGTFTAVRDPIVLHRKGKFKTQIPVDLAEAAGLAVRMRNIDPNAAQAATWGSRTTIRVRGVAWDADSKKRRFQ